MQRSFRLRLPAGFATVLLCATGICSAQPQNVGALGRGVSISFANVTSGGATGRGVSIGFQNAAGTIQVTTNISAAAYMISGPATYTGSGQSFTKTGAPAGTYTIAYSAVPGFTAPASETLTLSAGSSIMFSRTYLPLAGIGRIQVTSNLDAASYNVVAVTNTPGFTPFSESGKFYDTGLIVPAGTYQITFSGVLGYFTPPTQTLSLGGGGTLQFSGIYRRIVVVLFTGRGTYPTTRGVVYADNDCPSGTGTLGYPNCAGMVLLAANLRSDSQLQDGLVARTFGFYDTVDFNNSSDPWDRPPSDSSVHEVARDWLLNTVKQAPMIKSL